MSGSVGGGRTFLGIDIGTSLTKAALFDDRGDLVGEAEQPTTLAHSAGGHVEQDLDDVVASVAEVVRTTLADLGPGEAAPELVAVTGQGDGCWLVDSAGRAVRPAVSWMDGRAGALTGRWERGGVADAYYRVDGNMLFPGSMAGVLATLDSDEPQVLDRASTAHHCVGAVFQRLTGMRATDPSDVALPFDEAAGGYSDRALSLTGLTGRRGLLPDVVRPVPVARLSGAGARVTGLVEGTPVSAGPYDLPACAIGAGVGEVGDGVLTVGTTLACQVLVYHVDTSGTPTGNHLAMPVPGRWLRALPAMVGTASLDWVLDLVGMRHAAVGEALRSTSPGAGGVEVLPHFAPSGERAPFVDARARGQLTGLSLTTGRADLARGVCEGVAFAARDCFDRAGLTGQLSVCGGGTRSPEWMQVFADVLGRPLRLARAAGIGARGAVLTHLQVAGQDPDIAAWTGSDRFVEPDPARSRTYEELFARYVAHQQSARQLWQDVG